MLKKKCRLRDIFSVNFEQVFSDPECDSLPSFWNTVGIPEEVGTDNECDNIRSPLTLLPPVPFQLANERNQIKLEKAANYFAVKERTTLTFTNEVYASRIKCSMRVNINIFYLKEV